MYNVSHCIDQCSVFCIVHCSDLTWCIVLKYEETHTQDKFTMYYIITEKNDTVDLRCQTTRLYQSLVLQFPYLNISGYSWVENCFFLFSYHGILPNDLQKLFVKRTPSYSTRRTNQFMRENVRTDMSAMFLPVFGVQLWNSLNTLFVSKTSRYKCKRHYVNILLHK